MLSGPKHCGYHLERDVDGKDELHKSAHMRLADMAARLTTVTSIAVSSFPHVLSMKPRT